MSRSGMTLIEALIALIVTGIVLTLGYRAFASVIDHRRRADDATESVVRAAAIRESLRSWLAGARLVAQEGGPAFRGIDGTYGDMPDDAVTFLTGTRTPLGDVPAIMSLTIDRDDDTPESGLVAEFVEWRGTATARVQIEPLVVGLEIRYLSGVRGDPRWLPSWISSSVLPAGIELRLIAKPGDSLPPLLERPLLVPLVGTR